MFKNNCMTNIVTLALMLTILPHCAKYKPSSLPYPTGFTQEAENVQIITRKLTDEECSVCFDSKQIAKKYDAVQIYVKNNRNKPIVLSSKEFDVTIENVKNVSKTIHRNTAGRVAGYGIGALFLWPLIIPAAVDGAKSSNANYKADQDIKVKVLGQNESEVIQPNNAVNKVFFVAKGNIHKEFNLTLLEHETMKKVNFYCMV